MRSLWEPRGTAIADFDVADPSQTLGFPSHPGCGSLGKWLSPCDERQLALKKLALKNIATKAGSNDWRAAALGGAPAFHNSVGWEKAGVATTDALLWEDLRIDTASHVHRWWMRVSDHLPVNGERRPDLSSGPLRYLQVGSGSGR